MLRSFLGLALAFGLALPLTAGEMDNDNAVKKVQSAAASPANTASAVTAVSELDKESPTQSWRHCGWGGWGCGVGYRGYVGVGYPYCGWGGCYRPYYSYYGYGYPYYGGVSVGFGYARPWGGVRIGFGI